MQKKSIIMMLVILFLYSTNILAAPSISGVTGTISNGQSITISGSSFGTKSTAAPVVWDNFETGTSGQAVAGKTPVIGSSWSIGTSQGTPTYSTASLRTNSSRSVALGFNSSVYRNYLQIVNSSDELYFTFWARRYSPDSNGRNWKPYYLYSSNYSQPDQALGTWSPDMGGWRVGLDYSDGTGGPTIWGPTDDIVDLNGKWIRFEVYVKQSSANTSNGATVVTMHYEADNTIKSLSNTAIKTNTSTTKYGMINIGQYEMSQSGHTATVYIDDVYFDTSRARVEIGNASTWSSCTRREIQIHSGWGTSSITAKINQGAFSGGQTAYLYVVDSNGNVNSQGYPITFGSGSSANNTPPAVPTGITLTISQ